MRISSKEAAMGSDMKLEVIIVPVSDIVDYLEGIGPA